MRQRQVTRRSQRDAPGPARRNLPVDRHRTTGNRHITAADIHRSVDLNTFRLDVQTGIQHWQRIQQDRVLTAQCVDRQSADTGIGHGQSRCPAATRSGNCRCERQSARIDDCVVPPRVTDRQLIVRVITVRIAQRQYAADQRDLSGQQAAFFESFGQCCERTVSIDHSTKSSGFRLPVSRSGTSGWACKQGLQPAGHQHQEHSGLAVAANCSAAIDGGQSGSARGTFKLSDGDAQPTRAEP